MRKLILILAFLVAKNLFCNPVIPPPVISEFFLNGGNWQIEVFFDGEMGQYLYTFESFDELRLVSNTDTAYFQTGLPFQWDSLMVLDQNSLTSTFNIDPLDDFIHFEVYQGNDWGIVGDGIRYGDTFNVFGFTICTPPGPYESIGYQRFLHMEGYYFYVQHKQSPPSIGEDAFEMDSRSSFSGYVFDQHGNPVQNVLFHYCPTNFCLGWTIPEYTCFESDEFGYFEAEGLFCKWHWFRLIKDDYLFLMDTIFFEPDSAYYKEYTLNSVSVSDNDIAKEISIQLAPNPFKHKTSFRISIPDYYRWNEAEINIRNMNGQLVDVIHIPNAVWSGDNFSIDWYPARAATTVYPGLYLYTLEVDGKYVSSDKMIITD
ncbi:MAG: T9SS type A sorting domain-containing protein [Bacteroidetes bacterium]|nr:T9SS type A sorting domain-containing protein [Bacteroidota bacterium]